MASPPRIERIVVVDAVDAYLRSVASETSRGVLAPSTQRSYVRDLREFQSLVGDRVVLDEIEGPDVDDVLVEYQATPDRRYSPGSARQRPPGRSAATVNRFRQSVSRFFAHAVRHGWVQVDPFQLASPPARSREPLRSARTALSASAARALLDSTERPDDEAPRVDQDLAQRNRLLVALLLVLGPRVSEVVRTDLDDLVREPHETRWRIRGKGGVPRTVVLSPPLAEALATYTADLRPRLAARRPDDPDTAQALFLTWRGRRMDAQGVRDVVRRATARMPEEYRRDATPHALRHTTATVLVAHGWDVKVVAELLGHASIATTNVYLDRIDGELAAAIRAHPLSGPRESTG
ncbi:Site-specific recombinase XerD [Paraoerskovia marina]|uniref:Site-specific recombinase XerD n=1 Tax=Paraoerskovia marina TaxID=545619 RepID=A0A1H1SVL5_9CELL|nr:tyrosine-type recombinase/integrase [Paraoerskovia marina]SDS51974.1 Site-specific recombinase XerD [Paraoerskovia marina]